MQKYHSNIQIQVHFNLTRKCSKTQQKISQVSTLIYYYVKKPISVISGLILPLLTTGCFIQRRRRNTFQLIFQLILCGEKFHLSGEKTHW